MLSWKWSTRLHESTISMFDCGHTVLIMMLSPARGYMFNICKLHDYKQKSLTIHRNPSLWKGIPYCRRKPLTRLLYTQSFTIEWHPLLQKEIPYYRRNSLTIEGNALRIITSNSWKSPTIEGSPLLLRKLLKKTPYYRTKTLSIL